MSGLVMLMRRVGLPAPGTLKHSYLQSLRSPGVSTLGAPVFCNSHEEPPGIFFSGYQPRAGIKLSIRELAKCFSLVFPCRAEPHEDRAFPNLPTSHTVCAWPRAHIPQVL